MKSISAGDVYFLKSPFHSTVSSLHEKKLAYMLGTVSSRPAIVIRPPMWWDEYSTVTVIPALSSGRPAITLKLEDRFGMLTESTYPFTPHTPHSIPVGRLGRYIGRLEDEELEEILYAYKWIHDPFMMHNPTEYPVPPCYQDVIGKAIPNTKVRKTIKDVDFTIDKNLVIHSENQDCKDIDGMTLDINLKTSITPCTVKSLEKDPDYHPVAAPATEVKSKVAQDAKTETTKVEKPMEVPVEQDFPTSIFSEYDLRRVANRFDIDARYYEGPNQVKTRNPFVLTEEEMNTIRNETPKHVFNTIMEFYQKLPPFDAFLLGPRLPTNTLCALLKDHIHFSIHETITFKKLCTFMKDMSEEEYRARLAKLKQSAATSQSSTPTPKTKTDNGNGYESDQAKIRDLIIRIAPYLNEDDIYRIPLKLQADFLRIPPYAAKRAFKGKGFQVHYPKAVEKYKK